MKVFRETSFILIVFVLLWGLSTEPSFALEEQVFERKNTQKITLEPALQEVILHDEVEIPITITLENSSADAEKFRMRAVDFGTLDESGGVAFLGTGDPRDYDVASWLTLPVEEILVSPQSKTVITLTVVNSGKLAPGGHYGAILFESSTLDNSGDTSRVAIEQVFSGLIYMRKVGGEIFALDLNEIHYPKNIFRLPDQVALRFTNTGNTHVVPRGAIRVSDPVGRVIEKAILNQESSLVLPNSTRRFTESFSSLGSAWIPGKYTVLMEHRYDGKDVYEKKVEKYWYFPPGSIVGLFVLVGIAVFVKSKKNSWKKLKKKSAKTKKEAL